MSLGVVYLELLSKALQLIGADEDHARSIYSRRIVGTSWHELDFTIVGYSGEEAHKNGKYRVKDGEDKEKALVIIKAA